MQAVESAFDHHDGMIHQGADRRCQAAECHDVEPIAQRMQHQKSSCQGQRDDYQGRHCPVETTQKCQNHQPGDQAAEPEGDPDVAQAAADQMAQVIDRHQLHTGWQVRPQCRQSALHGTGDTHIVGSRLGEHVDDQGMAVAGNGGIGE